MTRPIKGSEKERQETDAFLIDNPQDYPVAVTGKLYTLRHLSTNRDPGNFGSRIILWNANPVTADATGKHRQLFRTLCRDRRHPSFCLARTDAGRIPSFLYQRVYKEADRRIGILQNQPFAPAPDRCGRLAA